MWDQDTGDTKGRKMDECCKPGFSPSEAPILTLSSASIGVRGGCRMGLICLGTWGARDSLQEGLGVRGDPAPPLTPRAS